MKEYLFKVMFVDKSIVYISVLAPSISEARKIFRKDHIDGKSGTLAGFGVWGLVGVYRAVS